MYYQGNAIPKRKLARYLTIICILILIAIVVDAWCHDTPAIRNNSQTHALSERWLNFVDRSLHWHMDADERGVGGWDKCVADAYDPETDSYNLPGGECADESPPPPPPIEVESEQVRRGESEQQKAEEQPSNEPDAEQNVTLDAEVETTPAIPTGFYEFTLELNAGWNMVHIPLELLAIDDEVVANETIGELFLALDVGTMYYHDGACWVLADDTTAVIRKVYQGFAMYVEAPVTKTLLGLPLSGNFILQEGMNIVGIPRHTSALKRISDLFGLYPEICVILVEDEGTLKSVGRAGDPGDIPITGGQAFGIISKRAYFTTFHGEPWGEEIYE